MSIFNFRAKLLWQEEVMEPSPALLEDQQSAKTIGNSCQVQKERCEQLIEIFISNLLRYGVFVASAVVFVGGFLYLIVNGAEPANYQFFRGEPSELCSPVGVVRAALSGDSQGIIQLGLLLLIATPVARVAFSLLAFLWQRDITYVLVTSFVFSGLIYSFLGAYS